MDSILFLIAQFLAPHALSLDVVPFAGPAKEYAFTHPIGVFLLKLEGKRLVVELAFRTSHTRVAGDYLEAIKKALAQAIPLDENTELRFQFERHLYIGYGFESKTDLHASTFQMIQTGEAAEPDSPLPDPEDA